MSQITIDLSDEVLLSLKLSPDKAREELLMVAAIKLYELGRLSAGAAAQLAEVPKPLFLTKLSDYGVETFRMTEEQLRRETRLA